MLRINVNTLCPHRDQALRTVKLERIQRNRRGETAVRSVIWTGCEDCLRVLRIYCSMPEHRTRCLLVAGEPEAVGQVAFREPTREGTSSQSGIPEAITSSFVRADRGLHYRSRYTKGRNRVTRTNLAKRQAADAAC